jgi:hypothetical protein
VQLSAAMPVTASFARALNLMTSPPRIPLNRWPQRSTLGLWELIRADIAEAEFIELAVSQLMKFIHHVIVAAFKTAVNPSGF